MHLELTDAQTEALIRELSLIIENDRYRLSPCQSHNSFHAYSEHTLNLASDTAACSAARNAGAGAVVPGERAPVGASRGSPSVPLCGTLAAGILAIVAAVIGGLFVYCVGVKQIRALQEQNADLKRAEQRRLAQERSNVARVLWSCLGYVESDIKRASFSGDPNSLLSEQAANSPRHSIGKPNFDYLRERVGSFAREDIVPAFLGVERLIDELRAEEGKIPVDELRTRLDNLLDGVRKLRVLAMVELERARDMLSGNEPPSTTTDRGRPMRSAWSPFRRNTPSWNEHIKLTATLFNNLASASFIGATVAPIFTNQSRPWWIFWGGVFLGLFCHGIAQKLLRDIE
jgi:hypothetical protein